jgi:hypothetical protein
VRAPVYLLIILGLLLVVLALVVAPDTFLAPREEAAPPDYLEGRLLPLHGRVDGPMPADSVVIADAGRGRVYVARPQPADLIIFDLQNGGLGNYSLPLLVEHMALSPDGERLYLAERPPAGQRTGSILVVDPVTPQQLGRFTYVCPETVVVCGLNGLAVGPERRLYLLARDSPFIDILDGNTGALLTQFPYPDGRRAAALAVHGATLYAADLTDDNEARQLRSFAIDALQPTPKRTRGLPVAVEKLHVAPDGSFLLACAAAATGPILQISTGSLREQHTYTLGPTETYPGAGISADSQTILVLHGDASQADLIRAYDAGSHDLRRVWKRPPDADVYSQVGMVPLADGGIAYVEAGGLRQVVTDAPAPPPVAYTYCDGTEVDDFSSQLSRWPTADTQSTLYTYEDGTYRIWNRVADQWRAVGRDDYYDRSRNVSVTTWLTTEQGTSGLVFGLNADWSAFYVFEITPSSREWAVLRHREGQWELLASDTLPEMRPPGQPNTLELDTQSSATHAYLKINGLSVHSLTEGLEGRIALSAASYGSEADARFDDYRGLARDCRLSGEAQGGAPEAGDQRFAPAGLRSPLAGFAP